MDPLQDIVDEDLSQQIRDELHDSGLAENALIYLALQDASYFHEAGAQWQWFSSQVTRKLYRAMGEMIADGRPVDVITVAEWLMEREPRVNWAAVTTDTWRNATGVRDNLQHYVEVVRTAHTRRRAREIAAQLMAGAHTEGSVDTAIRELMDLGSAEQRYEHDNRMVIKAAVEFAEQADEKAANGGTVGLPTGLMDLDEKTGGMHDTDLIVIPARPAMAKTSLLLNLGLNCQAPFGVISSEQAYDQMGVRMVSIQGRVSGNRIRKGTLREEDWTKFSNGARQLVDRPFYINDDPMITIDGIRRQARKWVYTHGIKILFVDYLQRIAPLDRRAPTHEQVKETTQGLKSLAKELRIPIVALAQVNRECEKRHDKRPLMGDIADASIIEKEADSIWTLYRDEVYNPDTDQQGIAEIGICKNRHGPIGVIRCAWEGAFFRFSNLTHDHYQQYANAEGRA